MADSLFNLFSLRKDLSVVVSMDSLEIFCFKCDMEVLDEDVVRSSNRDRPVLQIRKRLICLLEEHFIGFQGRLFITRGEGNDQLVVVWSIQAQSAGWLDAFKFFPCRDLLSVQHRVHPLCKLMMTRS